MAEGGYYKIYRKSTEDELYFSEPFTKWQAWCDLISISLWKDQIFFVRGIKIEGKRGCFYMGSRELAKRWRWSRGKVERFLTYLISVQKIEPQTEPQNKNVIGCYSVVNYLKYQSNETRVEPQTGPQTGPHIEEDKEYNNISTSTAPARTHEEKPLNASTQSIEPKSYIDSMKQDHPWQEALCMKHHIPRDQLLQKIDEFALDMKALKKPIGADETDAIRHFTSWLRIVIQNEQKQNKIENNGDKQRLSVQRRGVEATAITAEDYKTAF